VQLRDKQSRQRRWELLDEDLDYQPGELDRSVVAVDQIRTIIQTFRDKVRTVLFPGRTHVPKTLVFAKDDSHADDIVRIILEEFGQGNDFCRKITYRTTGDTAENLIKAFRNMFYPRIAVTVDMISTGTDIRPLECLLFMRDVKSQGYYEQMKGRGTRVIDPTDLKAVTPDTEHKTHFVLVDAVGVTESDKTDSRPLERKPHLAFDQLLNHVALGALDPDTLTTLAGRLARLDQALAPADRQRVEKQAGHSLGEMANALLDATDPDEQVKRAKAKFGTETPSDNQVQQAATELAQEACAPFHDPDLREFLLNLKRQSEQTLDHVTKDEVILADFDTDHARRIVASFREFIETHKDELDALQIIYSQPRKARLLTYAQIKELADAIGGPPHYLLPAMVWQAYQHLEQARVKNASPVRVLTDIISLVRFATGAADRLEPYPDRVRRRFDDWLARQEAAGRGFTDGQKEWLAMIRDRVATSAACEAADLQLPPFSQKGGPFKARQLFGEDWGRLLSELNEELAA
jgi:type I restriction enzyme R subunit